MRARGLPGSSMTYPGRALGAIALLALIAVVLYRQIALTNLILSGGDAFTYFYPYRAYAAQMVQSGRMPLWNPYLFMGAPFLANSQAAVLYPLNLALLWLPAPKIVAWSIVLHVAMAAAFAYLYARQCIRLSIPAAFLAAAAFAFGGFVSGQVEHVNQLNVSAWFPLLLLLWDLRSRARWPALLGAGVTVGLGLLAGHTQSSYISMAGLGAYALLPVLVDLWRGSVIWGTHAPRRIHGAGEASQGTCMTQGVPPRSGNLRDDGCRGDASPLPPPPAKARDPWRALRTGTGRARLRPLAAVLLHLGLVAAVGIALAAIQLVPTWELARLSIRSGGLSYREAIAFSMKPLPRLLWHALLPPWGRNLPDVFGGDYYTEYLAYIGVVPLVLAAIGVVSWLLRVVRDRSLVLHETDAVSKGKPMLQPITQVMALAVLGFTLALGGYNPLYWVLYKVMPGFNLFRVPARWLLLYAFGVAMLAGVGMHQVQDWISSTVRARHSKKDHETECSFACGKARSATTLTGMLQLGTTAPLHSARGQIHVDQGSHSSISLIRPQRRWPSTAVVTLLVVVSLGELAAAAQALPFSHPTAPEAFSSLRTAPAHILAAQGMEMCPGRFLSMSDILFDPGDQGEIEQMFRGTLSEKALYDYVVCVKRQEILAPNLPLAWRVYAVDGYDGGVLPLAQYVGLQRLFLEEDQILSDGRLREGLREIPPSRLLSIAGVRYVITDKVQDVWIDDVFYDLAFDAALGEDTSHQVTGEITPPFAATAVGLVSFLEGGQRVADGTPVAELRLVADNGETRTLMLQAGRDTAEGIYQPGMAHAQARVGHRWRDRPEGADYVTRLEWGQAARIARVEVVALPFGGRMYPSAQIHVRGLTLIDGRDGSSVPVILSTAGRYKRVHSGDVKIYEVLDAMPRAFVVHQAQVVADDYAAITMMRDPSFDPGEKVILAEGREIGTVPPAQATVAITRCDPEAVTVQAELQAPGYLVLSDTWYPGWTATVDGRGARVERANVNSRAVFLEAGTHEVRFVYAPSSCRIGMAVSAVAVAMVAAALWWAIAWKRRHRAQSDTD